MARETTVKSLAIQRKRHSNGLPNVARGTIEVSHSVPCFAKMKELYNFLRLISSGTVKPNVAVDYVA